MKDALLGLGIVVAIVLFGYGLLYPYYNLMTHLEDIAEELKEIRRAIEDKKVTE